MHCCRFFFSALITQWYFSKTCNWQVNIVIHCLKKTAFFKHYNTRKWQKLCITMTAMLHKAVDFADRIGCCCIKEYWHQIPSFVSKQSFRTCFCKIDAVSIDLTSMIATTSTKEWLLKHSNHSTSLQLLQSTVLGKWATKTRLICGWPKSDYGWRLIKHQLSHSYKFWTWQGMY